MDWLLDCCLALAFHVNFCLFHYVICPLVKFATWYLIYTAGAIVLNVIYKLRYEFYNEDLKYKRAECRDRVLLITGATSGIGLAAARYFHSRGFVVIACYYSQDEPGYKELTNLSSIPSCAHQCSLHLIKLDVRSSESIEQCYKQTRIILNHNPKLKLHAILNVAGIGYFYKFQWFTKAMIKNIVETNLLGAMLMTRQFMHLLAKNSGARVVNVASPLSHYPVEYNAAYGATKAALTQFSNALEIDLLPYKVATCTIHPGNLIRNTAVIMHSLGSKLDMIMPELNDEERQLYKTDLEAHLKYMGKVEAAFKRPNYMQQTSGPSFLSKLRRFYMLSMGAIPETRIDENADFMLSFDNAVRMRAPPKELAAGNRLFNLVIWSVAEQTSRALSRDIPLMLQRLRLRFVI